MFGQREGGAAWHHRSASSRRDHEEDQLLAAVERKELAAQKFDEWVRFKDSFDRGLALFAKLNSSHCEVCLCWFGLARHHAQSDCCCAVVGRIASIRNLNRSSPTYMRVLRGVYK